MNMLCSRKESDTSSSHILLHSVTSPLLSHCDGSSELSSMYRYRCYPVHQQQPMSGMTGNEEFQAPLCLQHADRHAATDKTSGSAVDDCTTLHIATHQNVANCRKKASTVPSQHKDAAYYEKRRKNNESARKSREARQHREQVVVAHVQILKEENMRLKAEYKLLSRQSGELLARLSDRSSDHKN